MVAKPPCFESRCTQASSSTMAFVSQYNSVLYESEEFLLWNSFLRLHGLLPSYPSWRNSVQGFIFSDFLFLRELPIKYGPGLGLIPLIMTQPKCKLMGLSRLFRSGQPICRSISTSVLIYKILSQEISEVGLFVGNITNLCAFLNFMDHIENEDEAIIDLVTEIRIKVKTNGKRIQIRIIMFMVKVQFSLHKGDAFIPHKQ